MAVKRKCDYCKKSIDASASRCPHCQGEYTPEQVAKRVKVATEGRNFGCGCMVAIVAAIALYGTIFPEKKAVDQAPSKSVNGKAANAKDLAIGLLKSVSNVAHDCDASASKMADAVKSGDLVFAYRAADQTEGNCLSVPRKIREIEVPSALSEQDQKAATEALKACENTYLAKWDGAKTMKAALDGDTRPSVLANMQDNAEMVQRGTLACAAGLTAIAVSHGAKAEDLGLGAK